MNKYKKISLIVGWSVFLIALITYTLTLEPTTSLWDCGEFIATSYKMQVGHPPGTPFFFLINRFGAMFAGEPENVAYAINFLSGLESAFTIAFMFWTIVMLGRMMYKRASKVLSNAQECTVLIGAAIGSLAYAFTDTFWFSAVEAEVYALSSLFTALVFWAILKWETKADDPQAVRWLILIAYLMGLSIGAHILNLLAIPALVFVYYFKKFPNQKKSNVWKPLALALFLTGVFYMLTPTVVSIGAFVDRVFVNSFSLPVNSGLTTFVVLLLMALSYGVWWSYKKGHPTYNAIFLSATMVVIGFSSYGIVLIRSSANPPMNSNNPSDPYTLLSFINREQYGSAPLINGESFASPMVAYNQEDSYYVDKKGQYKKFEKTSAKFDEKLDMFFPRLYSQQHKQYYNQWVDIKGKPKVSSSGELINIPTFGENLNYFFKYQMNHMYWRYFLWNFVGRQSDIQSSGNIDQGQWLSGIQFIDEMHLGPQDNLPSEIANNKGRNTYYFIPLIFGILGLLFHLKKDGQGFSIVMLLFFMTGIAIILYLNQTPMQPRERDYAYVGSFYAFALWIGFGVMWLCEWLNKKLNGKTKIALITASAISLSIPTVLAVQNWDDHDRSGRTLARDMGRGFLDSTLPNAILVNYGDNDTFPVWYAQEVEEHRTDVRVMNASYIQGGWYANQMRVKTYESAPVPFSIPAEKYAQGESMMFPIIDMPHPKGRTWTAKEVMAVVNSNHPSTKRNGYDFIPAKRIALPVNKENAIKSGILKASEAHLAVDTIFLELNKEHLTIDEMLMIDLLANFEWKRPLHFTTYSDIIKYGLVNVSGNEKYSYLQNQGLTYMLTPIKTPIVNYSFIGRVNSDELHNNLFNVFKYGNIADTSVYTDNFIQYTLQVNRLRETFAQLADALIQEGDTTRAIETLDEAMRVIPTSNIRHNDGIILIIETYMRAGAREQALNLAKDYARVNEEYYKYYAQFTGRKAILVKDIGFDYLRNLYTLYAISKEYNYNEIADSLEHYFENLS